MLSNVASAHEATIIVPCTRPQPPSLHSLAVIGLGHERHLLLRIHRQIIMGCTSGAYNAIIEAVRSGSTTSMEAQPFVSSVSADLYEPDARLPYFPTEIITQISKHLHPSSILMFALANKDFCAIAKPLLEERRKFIVKYTTIEHTGTHTSNSIPSLLEKIAGDPVIAYYIRHLTISSWSRGHKCYRRYIFKYSSSLKTAIRTLVTKSDGIAESKKSVWIRSLEDDGDQEPLVALLLLHLTHVKTITLGCPGNFPSKILETVTQISRSPNKGALTRLHTVTLESGIHHAELLEVFAGIPSVQSILRAPMRSGGIGAWKHFLKSCRVNSMHDRHAKSFGGSFIKPLLANSIAVICLLWRFADMIPHVDSVGHRAESVQTIRACTRPPQILPEPITAIYSNPSSYPPPSPLISPPHTKSFTHKLPLQ